MVQTLRAFSWHDSRTTGGAHPASIASLHRLAHRHHLSPGLRPGKPYMGLGVERSLPWL